MDFFITLRATLADTITGPWADTAILLILLAAIALAAVVGYYVTRLILAGAGVLISLSPTTWDDDLINPRLMRALSQLTPALIIAWLLPRCLSDGGAPIHWLSVLCSFYIVWASVHAISIFLSNLHTAFEKRPLLRPYAVKGIFQMVRLLFYAIAVIICVSLIIGKTPIAILTALGASAAILMLVFKDTILGLVAGVQLTANKMMHKGDWVVVPTHSANGEVIDISLTTVKIRNWDNSVTTVPPYSLISESFRNYQPMRRDGGRRVSRAIYIDINTIRYLTPAEMQTLLDTGWLTHLDIDPERPVVNLTLFRRYLLSWLQAHPDIRTDMTHMVRQLDPTPSGLPLELYFFTRITDWVPFETLQSDIFDHIYAAIPHFSLALFQTPAGRDLPTCPPARPHTPHL